ncbi:MAG: glycosyltransferase family 2 protein [Candidatus Firestonebacteria bacterium]
MKVSAVIINHNGSEFLEKCVNSVLGQSLKPVEVMIIDSCSTDSSGDIIAKYGGLKVKILNNNIGFAAAANMGIRETSGDYVLILNSDTCLKDDFLLKLSEAAEKLDNSYGMLSGKLLRMQEESIVDSAGQFIRRTLRPIERNYGKDDKVYPSGQCFFPCGAVMLLKRKMLENVKFEEEYFDEDFFMYFEDFDLGFRANALGWKCCYESSAIAFHFRGGSDGKKGSKIFLFRKKSLELKRHLLANRYLVLTKNAPAGLIIRHLPYILIYELFFWIYLLIFDIRVISGMKKFFKLRSRMKEKGKIVRIKIMKAEVKKWII